MAQKAPVRLLSRTGPSIQLPLKNPSTTSPASAQKSAYASTTTARASCHESLAVDSATGAMRS